MILKATPFPAGTFNSLSDDISSVVEYMLRHEELGRELNAARREVRELSDNRPPSNADILTAMLNGLGPVGTETLTDAARRTALTAVVDRYAKSFKHPGAGRLHLQELAAPELRRLYVHAAVELLREDYTKLARKDDAPEHAAKLAEAEKRVAKIEKRIADHEAFALLNFRGGSLPVEFRSTPRQGLIVKYHLPGDAKDTTIGLRILEEFMSTWRSLAGHHPVPVTVHAVELSTLAADRRGVWRKAYELLKLKPATKTPLYQPRVELIRAADRVRKTAVVTA